MDDELVIAVAENGDPLLEQLSEEGFIDCTFRILNLISSEHKHRFHLAASYDGQTVGFDVELVKGIRGAFDNEMENLIPEHVYRESIRFLRSGPESDRLIMALAALYALSSKPRLMVDSFSFTGIALHKDDVDMEFEPITIKLFGNDAEDMPEDDYFESFFKLDLSSRLVFWNEKDPEYRDALIRGLSSVSAGAP
jgi:hypothetical protein